MPNPFSVLGIAENATDAEIKQAYLDHVRRYPPEREPARFQVIREAYESIRTYRDRLQLYLFKPPAADLDELVAQTVSSDAVERPGEALFKALLLDSLTARR